MTRKFKSSIEMNSVIPADSFVSKKSTVSQSHIGNNCKVINNSVIKERSSIDNGVLVDNSTLAHGCDIRNYAVIKDSALNKTIVFSRNCQIVNSDISGKTMIMEYEGSPSSGSYLRDMTVLAKTEDPTDFHIRGAVRADNLIVSGDVVISSEKENKGVLYLSENTHLGTGSRVNLSSEVSVLALSLTSVDEHSKDIHRQIVHLTGSPSEKYGYSVSLHHAGKLVSIKPSDLTTILLSVYGSHDSNNCIVSSAQKMFEDLSKNFSYSH